MLSDVYKAKIKFEGEILHPYLDTVGIITVGVGINIHSESKMLSVNWLPDKSGNRLTDYEILKERDILLTQQKGKLAGSYDTATKLRIDVRESMRLLIDHVDLFYDELLTLFEGFDEFPKPVKLALFDMIFNLGKTRLSHRFPKFCAAIRSNDWETAAAECSRRGISSERNDYVKTLLTGLSNAPAL